MKVTTQQLQAVLGNAQILRGIDFEANDGEFVGIIGPNGSGKSNISDAVRWVLGEQSTRNLRGEKMEDVIFLGTHNRKPTGFASVSLTIDNTDRQLAVDADDVTITRRLYRSGESEYRINKTAVRLKDITELLMDTGLGRDGYSIIGKGRIEEIVSSKPGQRREIFEEAAGISKYRYRKAEAEKKLENAYENLLRLKDIMGELEGRLEPLREQSEKAGRFLELSKEKKTLEISLWARSMEQSRAQLEKQESEYLLAKNNCADIEAVLEDVVRNVPAPKGDPKAPLKALVFDSQYDSYRGVVVYFRIMEGTMRTGQTIKMMATGASYQIVECGHLLPLGLEPCDSLSAGEVGYFTASIKTVSDTRIGDTITDAANPTAEPLPGYRPVQSMVYCGIYTEDGSKYPDLRDALEKLQLNDASLSFEPESSAALGFGFRCGFLGMLHMEVIQERLEREFDLDLVTTLPSVIYHVYKTNGELVTVDNPHNYPDPSLIERAEEPYVKVNIIAPNEYVGNIMPMCQDRRGEFKDMQYLDTHLVELHYQMPLNEIIYDFFDALKANTKGYASLDYELSGYRPSDLVKVDLLLNGDQVDALSFIAHRDKAYPRARRLCEKLKENIPRQLFEIPIQAAIGGRVIARETVKAMRKDVLAKCYGGDVTRKKKLLEKQKEGKKKMRALGTVQMPTEAFLAVLKLDE